MLVAARVRETNRPHLAVRPLLRRQPLDGVVAVLGLQREWIPLTLGVVAAADVLNRDGVPVAAEELGGADRGQGLATVRGALQDGRELAGHRAAVPRREVEVGREAHAIPHRHHDAALRAHVVDRGRSLPFRHRPFLAYWWQVPGAVGTAVMAISPDTSRPRIVTWTSNWSARSCTGTSSGLDSAATARRSSAGIAAYSP